MEDDAVSESEERREWAFQLLGTDFRALVRVKSSWNVRLNAEETGFVHVDTA